MVSAGNGDGPGLSKSYVKGRCAVSGCGEDDVTAKHYLGSHKLRFSIYVRTLTGSKTACKVCGHGVRNGTELMDGPHEGMKHVFENHLNLLINDLTKRLRAESVQTMDRKPKRIRGKISGSHAYITA